MLIRPSFLFFDSAINLSIKLKQVSQLETCYLDCAYRRTCRSFQYGYLVVFIASVPTNFVHLIKADHAISHQNKAAMFHHVRSLIDREGELGIKRTVDSTILSVWVVQSVKHHIGKSLEITIRLWQKEF